MNQVLKIIKWEFMTRVKSKVFIITMVLFPLIIIAMSVVPSLLINRDTEEVFIIGLVDESSGMGDEFIDHVNWEHQTADGQSQYVVQPFSLLDSAKVALLRKDIHAVVVLPDSVIEGETPEFLALSLGNFKIQQDMRQSLYNTVMRERFNRESIDPTLVQKLTERVHFKAYEVNESGETSAGNELVSFMIPFASMFILFMSIFVNGQLLLRSVMEERTSRVVEVLLSSASPMQIMTGKILGLGLLGLVQLGTYVIVGYSVLSYQGLGQSLGFSTGGFLFVYFLLGYFFYAAVFATMGTLFNSEQEAQQSTSIISIVAVLPMMLSSFFITNPSATATKIISFIPIFTPFMIPLRVGTGFIETWEIVFSALILLISVFFMFRAAGKIFRTTLLMYGKRITLPEIWRWVRT